MRVALIDDDEAARSLLARVLRVKGHEVVFQAADGTSGLLGVGACGADLIITDCQMPEMDGLTMVRSLRARGEGRPIIMMSGLTDERVVKVALAAGVTRYLTKPLNEKALEGAMADVAGMINREIAA